MKDDLRFVDSDMHIMEPPDLFERYLDPRFRHRVRLPIGADGRARRGTLVVDGLPTLGRRLQHDRQVLAQAGHLSSIERPAAFNTVVSEFLASLLYN